MRILPNPYGLMATPLPAIPTPAAPPSIEQTDSVTLDQVTAALPEAVDTAMQRAIPERYTPQLAAELAAIMANLLRQQPEQSPLTAAQRGTEWMLRYGCTPWCLNDHTNPATPEWHSAGPTETELRDAHLDTSGYSDNGDSLPWLSAETIVVNDKPQAYGRETRVLLGYGVQLAELTPADTRRALEAMRRFVTQLETVVDQADQIAADDFPGDPEIAQADREATDRRTKRISGVSA